MSGVMAFRYLLGHNRTATAQADGSDSCTGKRLRHPSLRQIDGLGTTGEYTPLASGHGSACAFHAFSNDDLGEL
jgi:hypothetical protein